jgi:hypothetical protein
MAIYTYRDLFIYFLADIFWLFSHCVTMKTADRSKTRLPEKKIHECRCHLQEVNLNCECYIVDFTTNSIENSSRHAYCACAVANFATVTLSNSMELSPS